MTEDKQEVLENEIVEEEVVHPSVDWTPEEYKHRSTDEDGNPDDKLTEKEALAQAKKEGITFRDYWCLVDPETGMRVDIIDHETQADAEAALAEHDDKESLVVAQARTRA